MYEELRKAFIKRLTMDSPHPALRPESSICWET